MKSPYMLRDLTALVLLLAGIVMAFIALYLPPPGEIHDSVLFIFAQILIYVGSIFGIEAYIRKSCLSPTLSAPKAFANAASEGDGKNVTDDAYYHKLQRGNEPLQDIEKQRGNEHFQDIEKQRGNEHFQQTQHRRNPNDRGNEEEED